MPEFQRPNYSYMDREGEFHDAPDILDIDGDQFDNQTSVLGVGADQWNELKGFQITDDPNRDMNEIQFQDWSNERLDEETKRAYQEMDCWEQRADIKEFLAVQEGVDLRNQELVSLLLREGEYDYPDDEAA